MNTFSLRSSQFYFPNLSKFTTPKSNPSIFISTRNLTISHLKHPKIQSKSLTKIKPLHIPNSQNKIIDGFHAILPNGHSRMMVVGAVSMGFLLMLMGIDEHQKALAFGPEGPIMEEFWDNVRRYGLYALTVSTGALYTIFQPIVELLKNPISAILILVILGGGFYIVTQVVSAMIGVNEFPYEYAY